MSFKDLPLLQKILVILFYILAIPFIVLGLVIFAIICIFVIPLEYPIYKLSFFYKKYRYKYELFITSKESYKVINYYKNYSLDFDYEEDAIKIGKITYYFSWFEILSYDDSGECVIAITDNDELELLKESSKIKGKRNVKILVNERDLDKEDISKARKDKKLILYKKVADLYALIESANK